MSIRKPLILSLAITTALAAANAPAVGGAIRGHRCAREWQRPAAAGSLPQQ